MNEPVSRVGPPEPSAFRKRVGLGPHELQVEYRLAHDELGPRDHYVGKGGVEEEPVEIIWPAEEYDRIMRHRDRGYDHQEPVDEIGEQNGRFVPEKERKYEHAEEPRKDRDQVFILDRRMRPDVEKESSERDEEKAGNKRIFKIFLARHGRSPLSIELS